MANHVRILNPGAGSAWTSPAQAERYVQLGQAIMTDEGLFFRAHARLSVDIRQETQGAGGIATREEMRALPLLRADDMLVVRSAPKGECADRAAHVRAANERAKYARAGGLAGVLAAMRSNGAGPSRP